MMPNKLHTRQDKGARAVRGTADHRGKQIENWSEEAPPGVKKDFRRESERNDQVDPNN